MSAWKEFSIEELGSLLNTRRVPLSSTQRSKRHGPYPYYGASGIVDYIDDYLFEGEHVLISEDGENLRTRKTPIAFTANGKFWVNNHAHILKCKADYLTRLVVYHFALVDLNEYITGAVQPKLNKAALCSIPISLPVDDSEQRAIAGVLSSLDDKIDLLHRQNKTLEALAETLFRQCFVEEASEVWEEGRLADIVDHIKIGVTPADQPNATYLHYSLPAFDSGVQPVTELGDQILSNKYQVVTGAVLVSKLNPRFPRIWPVSNAEPNAICSTEFQVLKAKQSALFEFVYYFMRSSDTSEQLTMAASGTSGSHQRVRPEDILSLTTTTTDQTKMAAFSKTVRPLLTKTFDNRTQIHTLEKLRDTLLPKLMSGEVRVKYE